MNELTEKPLFLLSASKVKGQYQDGSFATGHTVCVFEFECCVCVCVSFLVDQT